ncbi:DsbA family protein [Nocardioides sp.]|uniref:DsbA family protein n=1 Tax=Nocardioides sp. TaxID=35761 RepID=UPI0039E2355B
MSKASAQERAERAAAALAEQRRRERRRTVVSVVGVVLVMIAIVAGGALLGKLNHKDPDPSVSSNGSTTGTVGVAIGPADAPHTIVIYEDFICPFCGELEKASHEKLQELADDGLVRVEYRPFQLLDLDYSPLALQVFGAVRSLGDDTVTKEFHDLLYADQPSEKGPYPSQDDIIATAVQAGADESAVRGALDAGKDWADTATADAAAAGVQSTPTVLLDGSTFTDYRSVDDLADNLISAVS